MPPLQQPTRHGAPCSNKQQMLPTRSTTQRSAQEAVPPDATLATGRGRHAAQLMRTVRWRDRDAHHPYDGSITGAPSRSCPRVSTVQRSRVEGRVTTMRR